MFPFHCFYLITCLKRFPFDPKNPIGYLIAVVLEYITLAYEYFVIACTLSLGIGAYWIATSATKDIQKHILHSINETARENGNQLSELKNLLSEYNEAHAAIKQLSTAGCCFLFKKRQIFYFA